MPSSCGLLRLVEALYLATLVLCCLTAAVLHGRATSTQDGTPVRNTIKSVLG